MPTISPSSKWEPGRTRVYAVRYAGTGDYILVTRPLYLGLDDALREAEALKKRGVRVAASVVAERLSGYVFLLSRLGKRVDMVEVDLGLFYALHGFKRGFESYALDLLEEIIPASKVPLAVKLSPNMPISREFLKEMEEIGVNLLVFTTHPVYTVGEEIFRVHSTHLSLIYNSIWATVASEGLRVRKLLATEVLSGDAEKAFSGFLVDTTVTAKSLPDVHVENPFPKKWDTVARGLLPALPSDSLYCSSACPYGAFRGGGELVIAKKELCDLCGLCLSMCKDKVMLVKELVPS